MSGFIPNEGFGSLFDNNDKRSDKSPDFTGSAKINGRVVRISGWNTPGKNGRGPYISLRINNEEAPRESAERPRQQPQEGNPVQPGKLSTDYDDEIPF